MKKAFTLCCLFACFILLFSSCEKVPGHATGVVSSGTTSGGSTNTGTSYLTCKVDGASKTAALTVATYYVTGGDYMQISGQLGALGSTEGVSIMIQTPAVGTFDIAVNNTLFIYTLTSTDAYMGATTGSVTISAFTSDTITGTFSFTGVSLTTSATKTISSGTFSMKYTKL